MDAKAAITRGDREMKSTWMLSSGLTAAMLLSAAPALADTKEPAKDTGQIEEIIVTAQKRAENLQNVPMSVTAVSGDALEAQGVTNPKGLANAVPGLKVQGTNTPAVFIRGVGTSNSSSTGDQGVAIHLDGVFHGRPTAFAAGFLDVDHVEVLKGPQGTLYGRGALGGAVNVISKAPSQTYEGAARVEVGNYDQLLGSAALNLPLTDKSAVRAAVQVERHDGYSSNGGDDADNLAARLRYRYRPTDDVTIDLIAFYSSQKGKGATAHLLRSYPTNPLPTDPWATSYPGALYTADVETKEVSADLVWNLGRATLTYIPAFVNSRSSYTQPNLLAGGIFSPTALAFDNRADQNTHELRLDSPSDQRLQWTVGAYYLDEKVRYSVVNHVSWGSIETISKSLFGQASYAITDRIHVLAGGRTTKETKEQFNNFGYHYTGEWSPMTGKVELEYNPVESSMLYASVANGFKSGGFFTAPGANTFDPEKVVVYELGSKNRFLDNRLQLNGAVYRYDYDDYSVNVSVPGYGGTTGQGVFNAGRARVYGADAEMILRPTAKDRIETSIAYSHAKFLTFSVATTSGKAGDRLPYSPEWSANVAYQHVFNLANGACLTPRLETHFETSSWLTANHSAFTRQGAFAKSSATLTYAPAAQPFTIALWARNIENKAVKLTVTDTSGLENDIVAPPRTYGMTLAAKF